MASVFSRVLLATEHSEFDLGAEALAFALARRGGLRLAAVLPVQSNPEFETVAPQLAAKAAAEAARRRQQLEALAGAEQLPLDLRVRHGPELYLEIVDEARRRQCDLIVIRRRGKRGLLANLLIGEMVSNVVAHAPCDVLIAPRGAALWSSRVLVGIDPQDPDAATLALAATIAADSALPLRVLCVAAGETGLPAAERALAASLQQARARPGSPPTGAVEGEVRIGRAHQALIDAAREQRADLIVIARHGGQNLGRAWIGGIAQKVIGLAECPVLVRVNTTAPTRTPA